MESGYRATAILQQTMHATSISECNEKYLIILGHQEDFRTIQQSCQATKPKYRCES